MGTGVYEIDLMVYLKLYSKPSNMGNNLSKNCDFVDFSKQKFAFCILKATKPGEQSLNGSPWLGMVR